MRIDDERTVADRQESTGDYSLRDVDLHVHTLTSNCGYTSHQRLLELTRAAGRRVVAVTDHDSAAGGVALREMAARSGHDLLVLTGMELTTSDLGHVVLFGRGVEEDWGWRTKEPFPRHIPDHWVAILAHPFRGIVSRNGHGLEVKPEVVVPHERIDAVEIWNGGDILKKSPQLRADLDQLSRDYVREHGKVGVASSDGHRPMWVHSFFTRFNRPLRSVDDLVEQVRGGEVTPMAQEEAYLEGAQERWRPRAVVEWLEHGYDWRAMAAAGGYTPEEAEEHAERYGAVRRQVERGATVGEIAGELGLSAEAAAEWVAIVDEETGWARQRAARLAKK